MIAFLSLRILLIYLQKYIFILGYPNEIYLQMYNYYSTISNYPPRFLTEFNRKLVILNFHLRIIAIMGAKGVRGE